MRSTLVLLTVLAVASPVAARDVLLPDEPRIRREQIIPFGDDPFWPSQVLYGSISSPARCATIRDAVWADVPGGGECIRYFASGLVDGANPEAMVFIHGDYLVRGVSGKHWVLSHYARHSPGNLELDAKRWGEQARVPALYLGRPGVYGSSGDHKDKAKRREVELINAALDQIKRRYRITRFHLAGQSGGGHSVAGLLALRRDIGCAAISSGAVAVTERYKLLKLAQPDGLYDPLDEVGRIAKSPAPRIFVLSDPEDRRVPIASQTLYVDRLRDAGLAAVHILATAKDEDHHGLSAQGRRAAALCVKGVPDDQIVRQVTAPDPEDKGGDRARNGE